MKHNVSTTVKTLPESIVEITGTLSWDDFSTYEKRAFDRLAAHLEIDGFRKGNVPEVVAKKHLGDELILADMAELALNELYPEIVKEHALDAIGRPTLAITKLARGNELGFTLTTAVLPAITLPDYKKIAKGIAPKEAVAITEEEVDKVIENLRQIRAYGHVHDHDEPGHAHDEPLPEVTDEFAKSFGNFATVAELRYCKAGRARQNAYANGVRDRSKWYVI
jgi:trigger factor